MGREVGYKCTRCVVFILFLAFFSVVASSPNLSTFCCFRLQRYEENEKGRNVKGKIIA